MSDCDCPPGATCSPCRALAAAVRSLRDDAQGGCGDPTCDDCAQEWPRRLDETQAAPPS